MLVLVAGLPLLFVHRHETMSRLYAAYAVVFVVLSQSTQVLLGECFLTTLARLAHVGAGKSGDPRWFSVRFANWVFGMAPSERAISVTFDVLVAIVAVGVLVQLSRRRARPAPSAPVLREPLGKVTP
jgi:hypothetical protein